MTNNLKRFFLSLLKKGGIGLIASLTLPAIVLAVTTIGTNIDTGGIVTVAGDLNASSTSYLSHTIPALNNAYDLGSATSSWRNVYASGTYFGGGFNASSTSYLSHTVPAGNNIWDLGSATSSWRNVYASGTYFGGGFNASSTSVFNNVIPAAVNRYDLGASGTPWRSISASTSIVLGRQAASTTLGIASNVVAGTKGQGTCIALRATDGTLLYLSATSSQNGSASWTALAVSTSTCQ